MPNSRFESSGKPDKRTPAVPSCEMIRRKKTTFVCLLLVTSIVLGIFSSHLIVWWHVNPFSRASPNRLLWNTMSADEFFAWKVVGVPGVDCRKLLAGDPVELKLANDLERKPANLTTDAQIQQSARSCSTFIEKNGFITDSLTEMESNFPLAFSVLTYKRASQVVGLLRAIYRPQNFYCIHVDSKSNPDFKLAIKAVTRCFSNVFLASVSVRVIWGDFSALEPELVCLKDLWKNTTWKYFINLTGQEFPLKTNYELVRILTLFNGANDIYGALPNAYTVRERWKRYLPAPHGIQMFKGAAHVTLSRAFVDFVLHRVEAQDFLRWCKQIVVPDEHFFSSLNHNPHLKAPGSYKGNMSQNRGHLKPILSRFKNWVPAYPCPGKRVVRDICIFSILDLPLLHRRPEFFANKFYDDYSRLALQCLAEDLHNRTRDEAVGKVDFNMSFYEQLSFLKDTFVSS